jgi:hypothetical protein
MQNMPTYTPGPALSQIGEDVLSLLSSCFTGANEENSAEEVQRLLPGEDNQNPGVGLEEKRENSFFSKPKQQTIKFIDQVPLQGILGNNRQQASGLPMTSNEGLKTLEKHITGTTDISDWYARMVLPIYRNHDGSQRLACKLLRIIYFKEIIAHFESYTERCADSRENLNQISSCLSSVVNELISAQIAYFGQIKDLSSKGSFMQYMNEFHHELQKIPAILEDFLKTDRIAKSNPAVDKDKHAELQKHMKTLQDHFVGLCFAIEETGPFVATGVAQKLMLHFFSISPETYQFLPPEEIVGNLPSFPLHIESPIAQQVDIESKRPTV